MFARTEISSGKKSSRSFNKFLRTYEEMSMKRLDFITAQNNLGQLKMKENQLNDLGDGFKVMDYENYKTEVQTLSSRIDQNEEKFEKMRQRFGDQKRKFEGAKGKRAEMKEMVEHEKKGLKLTKEIESSLYKKVYQLKEDKNQLKNEYDELLQKAGILKQNLLMRDYDKISDGVEVLSKKIWEMELENEKLSKRNESMQKKH